MERKPAYGQLQKVLELDVKFSDIGSPEDGVDRITVAVIRPVKLASRNDAGMPYFHRGDFAPLEIVDIGELSCLVARIPDPRSGNRGRLMEALYERPRVMGTGDELINDE